MIFSVTKARQKYKAVTLAQIDLLQLPCLLKTVHHIFLTKFVFFSVCTYTALVHCATNGIYIYISWVHQNALNKRSKCFSKAVLNFIFLP